MGNAARKGAARMLLPRLSGARKAQTLNDRFYGYQHIAAPAEGAFYDAENISTALFPLLAPRLPRNRVRTLTEPGGLCAKEKLAWVEDGQLFYDGKAVAEVSPGAKRFTGMGAWLLVWPDGVRYNTHDGTVDRLAHANTTAGEVSFTLCRVDGTPYEPITVSDTAPEDTTGYWLSTADEPHVLKKYSAATQLWNSIPTTYVCIRCQGIGAELHEGDTVSISGVTGEWAEDFNQDMILFGSGEDYLIVTAIIDHVFTQEEPVTAERKLPEMDFVTELGNRLWGCSSATNEIFACKLGDPTNWYSYQGLAGDSYAATVGSDGPFTGAATQNGYVLFFKERCIHKVYGTKPANFQITQIAAEGVQPGSADSLCLVGGVLYYKADHAVMACDGGMPAPVSAALGQVHYAAAVGGECRGRYVVSMRAPDGDWALFCFDPEKSLWARWDAVQGTAFAVAEGKSYMLDAGGVLWELEPHEAGEDSEGPVEWRAETGMLDLYELDAHYSNRIQLRVWMPAGSAFAVDVAYDGGEWLTLKELAGPLDQSLLVPVLLRRCGTARLRLRGTGPCKVYAMSRMTGTGEEIKAPGGTP